MDPSGLLMKEHRIIERVITGVGREVQHIRASGEVDIGFLDQAIDFMHTYADRTHHGKEEGILFATLENKSLTEQERETMEGLVEEHRFVRAIVARLSKIRHNSLCEGEMVGVAVIQLQQLVEIYPRHISREDRLFFPAVMKYLRQDECSTMVSEFQAFDGGVVHEKYARVAQTLERVR